MSETNAKQERGPVEPFNTIWKLLNNLPLAVGLILVLTVLSALGTVIPQEHLAQPPVGMTFDQMLVERFGETRYNLIQHLGLHRVYFTWYFAVLLIWLALSSLACALNRTSQTVKLFRAPRVGHTAKFFKRNKRAIVVEDAPGDSAAKLKKAMLTSGFRVREKEHAGGTCIYGDRGFLNKWALVVLHISVLILIIGAVYGKIYGAEGYIRMADDSEQDLTIDFASNKWPVVKPLTDMIPEHTYHLQQDHFRIDYIRKLTLPEMMQDLPEEIKDYYRYFVKDYVSKLTISRGGNSITREVSVNKPIKLDGLVVYQSGYSQFGYVELEYRGEVKTFAAPTHQWFMMTADGPASPNQALGSQASNEVFYLEPVKAGDLYVHEVKQDYIGPLTLLRVDSIDESAKEMMLLTPDDPYYFKLGTANAQLRMSKQIDNYSTFSYKIDPGVPVLYLGWILMTLGITLALYITFTRAWIRIEDGRVFMLVSTRGGAHGARSFYSRWAELLEDK
jgi:cytochrome c biogenesis protein